MPFYLRFLHVFMPVAGVDSEPRSSFSRELLLALTIKFALLGVLWFCFVRDHVPASTQTLNTVLLSHSTSNDIPER
jgi:hypothetical protein